MTLFSDQPRGERGKAFKQDRLDRQDRLATRFPWLMPAIVVLAIVVVVTGLIVAAALGKLF
ncbi:MAG TPA: hypothetical protein VFQ74_00925 [Pseudolysinimonas sp.]|nr:hypothetical protein [Pseudolysinimonas sp.]